MRQVVRIGILVLAALAGGCGETREPARNGVLLVTMDTFRADRAGCMGNPEGLTPSLDRIARRGFLCRDAFVPCPLTAVSHATVLTGLDPPRHGVRKNTSYVLADTTESIATRISAAGYRTAAMIAALPLERKWGFAQGFEHFDDRLGGPGDSRSPFYAERPARVITDESVAWMADVPRDEPWLLWAHYFDPHYPYEARPQFRRFPTDVYGREIREMDVQIGRLVREIRSMRGLRPMVVLTSDHGEALGQHGESSHGVLLYDETMRGFLAMAPGDGAQAGPAFPSGILTGVARQTDIAPTILDALGLDPPDGLDGSSLLRGVPEGRGAYGEGYYSALSFRWCPLLSWRDERWTYIQGSDAELYDRWTDPGEETNVATDFPDLVRAFSASLAAVASEPTAATGPALDPETEAQLLALGYVAGSDGDAVLEYDCSMNPRELIEAVNHMFRGIALMGQGSVAEALPSFQLAYRADPRNSTVLFHLADCLRTLGDETTALDYYRRSVEFDPKQGQAWSHMAVITSGRGQHEEAFELIHEGLTHTPRSFPLLMSAGDLSFDSGRRDEAEEFYRVAADQYPRRAEPWAKLAEVAESRGDAGEAEEMWKKAMAANPNEPRIPHRVRERFGT